jgi:hypothetical protein
MVDTTFPVQIVLLTQHYSFAGGVFLKEQRLSDFLNDKRDTNILLRNASVARLRDPARILEKCTISIIPKAGIVMAFEPPQKTTPRGRAYVKYPKQKYDVFLALDDIELHGKLNVQGPLNLQHAITNLSDSFMPITEAVVILAANPSVIIKRETVLVNVRRIRFIGEIPPADLPAEAPPEEKHQNP